jgi:drug/metabolite transporter (DMT)-like permease
MSWEILITIHILFSTAFALSFRRLAKRLPSIPRLASALMYLLVISPAGIIYALIQGDIDFSFSAFTWVMLLFAGLLFAGANIFSWRANSHIDAAQFAVIQNVQAIFTVIFSFIFLGERLAAVQWVGAVILVIAAALVSVKGFTKETFHISKWSWVAVLASVILGAAISNEKFLIGQMSLPTYYIIGWGLQTLWMTALVGSEWRKLPELKLTDYRDIIWQGLLRTGAGFSIVTALTLADSGLLSSIRSYKAVLVFLCALIFLGEKEHFWRKAAGSVLATIGLLLLIN